jgi:DNA-directed RNA polymerase specialized sigma24 family protein
MYNYSMKNEQPDDGKYEEYSEKELINALRKRDTLIKNYERKKVKWEQWHDHWEDKIENAHRLDMVNQDLEKSIQELKRVIDEERAMKEKIIEERDEIQQDVMNLESQIERIKFRMGQEKGHNLLTMKSKGMSYREIAEKTGLPLGTVKSRISKARGST